MNEAIQTGELNIEAAQELYKKKSEAAIHQNYKTLVKELIANKSKISFSNDSYLDALFLTDLIFENTGKNLRIVTGAGAEKFLEVLKESFAGAVERVGRFGGKVKLILFDESIPSYIENLSKESNGVLMVKNVVPNDEVGHFIASDDEMLRVEDPHPALSGNMPATTIKAHVSFDAPVKARIKREFFDSVWDKLEKEEKQGVGVV